MSDKGPAVRTRLMTGRNPGKFASCSECWRNQRVIRQEFYVYPVGEHLHFECASCGFAMCLGGDCPPGDYQPTLAGLEAQR